MGTSGNDSFIGTVDQSMMSTAMNSLNAGDAIQGGEGVDTLKIFSSNNQNDINLSGLSTSSVEKLVIHDTDNRLTNDVLASSHAFQDITLINAKYAYVYAKEGTHVTFQALEGGGDNQGEFYAGATDAATVSFNDSVVGAALQAGSSSFGRFYHGDVGSGMSKATTVNATLNLRNTKVQTNTANESADQQIHVNNTGNVATTVNTTVNVVNANTDAQVGGKNTFGNYVNQEIFRNGDATVNSVINVTDAVDVDINVQANRSNAAADKQVDSLTINLSNVSHIATGNISAGDFEKVSINVNGKTDLREIRVTEADDTPSAQTVDIVANADLVLDSSNFNDAGKVTMVVSGKGNVDLGQLHGITKATLSSTVTHTVDASGLTGAFKVDSSHAIQSIKGGAGDDHIIVRDVSTFGSTALGGLALAGGAGTDTVGFAEGNWATIAAGTAANRAKISGFEVLELHGALATATYDIGKLSGITGFTAADGVATGATAAIKNLGNNATVTLAGDLLTNNGGLTGTLKTDGETDNLTLVLNTDFADDNNTTAASQAKVTLAVQLDEVETLTVNASGTQTNAFVKTSGYKADFAEYTLDLTADLLTQLTIQGSQKLTFASDATQLKLASIDASSNTGGVTLSAAAANTTANGAVAMTIKGSATASNNLTGSSNADTLVGGSKSDTINGGAGADTVTLGAGNDTYVLANITHSTLARMDVITDFSANTFGHGAGGAANNLGANLSDATKVTGDVINLRDAGLLTKITVGVYTNAADAQTFLQNNGEANNDTIGVALDSSSGQLYIDVDANGTIDSVIKLTGVTTLTSAAFLIDAT